MGKGFTDSFIEGNNKIFLSLWFRIIQNKKFSKGYNVCIFAYGQTGAG